MNRTKTYHIAGKAISLILIIFLFGGCDKGELLDNTPPETTIFVSSINLTGQNRLTSEVTIYWSGEDVDGYVTGYEVSLDNSTWKQVDYQDSTFVFDLSGGTDTIDIDFYVRAIDNLGERDPTAAYLKVPIKNSPPTISFDSTKAVNDTVWSVFSVRWNAADPDGDETIDSVYIKLNNGSWFYVSPEEDFATIVPTDPTLTGYANANVYLSLNSNLQQNQIDDLNLNGDNTIYIRAIDLSGAESPIDTSKVFFVKKKSNDLLIIDTYASTAVPTPESVYFPALANLGVGFDYLNLESNGGANLPAVIDPTLGFTMNLYDQVFWYSDPSTIDGLQLYLEAASAIIQEYLNNGGKILVVSSLPNDLESTSPITQFSPIDSLSSSPGQARIPNGYLASPDPDYPGWDTLESSSFITGADPFYPSDSSNIMFTADLLSVGGWTGPNIVCARTTNGANTNQVFMSVDLHKLDARAGTVESFLNNVLKNEFNW